MSGNGFEVTSDLIVQGLIGALLFFWALKDAIPKYREMKKAAHPDPIIGAMSMAWDRDMQERLLQLIERMAKAQEIQAELQRNMAGSWTTMVDQKQQDMNEKIDDLLRALEVKERISKDDLSAFIGRFTTKA